MLNEIVNLDASKSLQETNIPNILPKTMLTSLQTLFIGQLMRLSTKENPTQVFSCEYCEILKTPIFKKGSKNSKHNDR